MLSADTWKEVIAAIKAKGMRAGVAVKPGTPVESVFPLVSNRSELLSQLDALGPNLLMADLHLKPRSDGTALGGFSLCRLKPSSQSTWCSS